MVSPEVLARWENALVSAKSNDAVLADAATSGKPAFYVLPVPNNFLPTDFSLRCDGEEESVSLDDVDVSSLTLGDRIKKTRVSAPSVLQKISGDINEGSDESIPRGLGEIQSSALLTWFKQDTFWKMPKLNVVVRIETDVAYSSPKRLVLTELFSKVLVDLLNEFTYYADCAGLRFSVTNTLLGFDISYFGYSHKLNVLVDQTIATMRKMCDPSAIGDCCSEDLFNRIKEKQSRDYYNSIFWQPYNHCVVGSSNCLEGRNICSVNNITVPLI